MKLDLPCLEQDTLLINSRAELPYLLLLQRYSLAIQPRRYIESGFNFDQDSYMTAVFVFVMARITKDLCYTVSFCDSEAVINI